MSLWFSLPWPAESLSGPCQSANSSAQRLSRFTLDARLSSLLIPTDRLPCHVEASGTHWCACAAMRNIDVFSVREYVCGFNPVCSPFHACVYAHESRLDCGTCACLDSFIIVCDHCVCVYNHGWIWRAAKRSSCGCFVTWTASVVDSAGGFRTGRPGLFCLQLLGLSLS